LEILEINVKIGDLFLSKRNLALEIGNIGIFFRHVWPIDRKGVRNEYYNVFR
jgi:hypothetical protein